jgi:hypothetical protein
MFGFYDVGIGINGWHRRLPPLRLSDWLLAPQCSLPLSLALGDKKL